MTQILEETEESTPELSFVQSRLRSLPEYTWGRKF